MPTTAKPRIAAIILAAGGSTRFGKAKQLHPYQGEPLIRRAVNATMEAGVEEVIVVLGAGATDIEKELDGISGIRIVVNPDWHTGLASSLRVGLSAISDADGVLVTLADQPFIGSAALRKLIEQFGDTRRIIASKYSDTVGAPAIFGNEYLDELKTLTGDHGAGKWIQSRISEVTIVPLESAAIDIDTPDDVARLDDHAQSGRT